jgi:hypothetical protein
MSRLLPFLWWMCLIGLLTGEFFLGAAICQDRACQPAPCTLFGLIPCSTLRSFPCARAYPQPIPCRPIMLDTAAAHLAYPSLDHRLPKAAAAAAQKKAGGSMLSSLGFTGWGWGGGSSKKQ